MSEKNLWNFDQLPVKETRSPAALLKEQAEFFNDGMRSRGLYAETVQRVLKDSSKIGFALEIIVPALDDYRVRLVAISFEVSNAYPVRVTSEYGDLPFGGMEAQAEDELSTLFARIFQHEKTRNTISSLIANSNL